MDLRVGGMDLRVGGMDLRVGGLREDDPKLSPKVVG